MKSSPLKLLVAFAFTTIVVQSIGEQSTNAQEKKFGNGRFIKRMFGDLIPQSKPAPRPNLNAKPKPGQQPTLAKRPSQTSQPTLANQKTRPRSTAPRSIQPARDVDRRATTNRLPKSPSADRQTAMPTRSTAKATLGFGMMVRVKGEKLIVGQIDPKGNAATAGVRTGDQLVTGGGIDFESVADFNGIAEILKDGDQLEFTVKRGGREKEMLIVYGKAPADQPNEMLEGSFEANNASSRPLDATRCNGQQLIKLTRRLTAASCQTDETFKRHAIAAFPIQTSKRLAVRAHRRRYKASKKKFNGFDIRWSN